MSGLSPPNFVCGWLGNDAIQQACASKLPSFSFLADQQVIERILAEGGFLGHVQDPGLCPASASRALKLPPGGVSHAEVTMPLVTPSRACVMVIQSHHKIETWRCKSWRSPVREPGLAGPALDRGALSLVLRKFLERSSFLIQPGEHRRRTGRFSSYAGHPFEVQDTMTNAIAILLKTDYI